uniref:Hexosyltransferase n=1 Tax=Panagrolaimus sp. ES5 TaxID=591445 RepID=A0AC34G204_9BILA
MLGDRPSYLFHNNWIDYHTVIEPSCAFNRLTRRKSLLIIVKSAPHRLQNRDAIRATWGKFKQMENFRIRTIFVMGTMSAKESETYGNVLEAEHKQFNDLLIGDFIDGYRNNTFKLMHALKFAQNYCSTGPVSYVFLVDDDYMISMKNLIVEVEKHPPNERLYMGWRFDTSPFRLVSLNDYPFSQYPPYISAGAVLLTSQTVREFYLAIQHLKVYPFDDVYAGIIAYKLGIMPQHNENFRFWSGNPETDVFDHVAAAHGYAPKDLLQQNNRVNNHSNN